MDFLLFNLLVLRCLTDKTGHVWRRSELDLYLVENMPLMKTATRRVSQLCVYTLCSVLFVQKVWKIKALFTHRQMFLLEDCHSFFCTKIKVLKCDFVLNFGHSNIQNCGLMNRVLKCYIQNGVLVIHVMKWLRCLSDDFK